MNRKVRTGHRRIVARRYVALFLVAIFFLSTVPIAVTQGTIQPFV